MTGADDEVLVFDTGPLSHFAKEGWLGVLRAVTGRRTAVVPDTVADELRAEAARLPHLQLVLQAPWLVERSLTGAAELAHFADFVSMLAAKGRNLGECGVLAYAKAHDATAIVDDGFARRAAQRYRVKVRGTLGLLCDAVHDGLLTVELISALADDLLEGEYRLPFLPGGFRKWAESRDLFPPGS